MINKLFKADWVLLGSVFLLLGIGLAVLYSITNTGTESSSLTVFWRQVLYAGLAVAAMLFFALSNFHYLRSYSTAIYFATLFVLLSVLIFGTTVRGTSGWIGLGAFRIQPVEISKIALIIFLASFGFLIRAAQLPVLIGFFSGQPILISIPSKPNLEISLAAP